MSIFHERLRTRFDEKTANLVIEAFKTLELPTPQEGDFLSGFAGYLSLINDYGLVIRVETSDKSVKKIGRGRVRIKHPLVLQPLISIDCKDATLEICPAVNVTPAKDDDYEDLYKKLKESGISFWDGQNENMGYITLPGLPDKKVTIVIDRNAVEPLEDVRKINLNATKDKIDTPQEMFDPLRQKAQECLNGGDMDPFYDLCKSFKENGMLICGWENESIGGKTASAALIAKSYSATVRKVKKASLS